MQSFSRASAVRPSIRRLSLAATLPLRRSRKRQVSGDIFCPHTHACKHTNVRNRLQSAMAAARIRSPRAPFLALRVGRKQPKIVSNRRLCLLEYACQPSVGCCPIVVAPAPAPAPTTTTQKTIYIQIAACPDASPPIASCGSCPTGYTCKWRAFGVSR